MSPSCWKPSNGLLDLQKNSKFMTRHYSALWSQCLSLSISKTVLHPIGVSSFALIGQFCSAPGLLPMWFTWSETLFLRASLGWFLCIFQVKYHLLSEVFVCHLVCRGLSKPISFCHIIWKCFMHSIYHSEIISFIYLFAYYLSPSPRGKIYVARD